MVQLVILLQQQSEGDIWLKIVSKLWLNKYPRTNFVTCWTKAEARITELFLIVTLKKCHLFYGFSFTKEMTVYEV